MLVPVWVWLGLAGLAGLAVGEPHRCCFDKQYSASLADVGEVLIDGGGPTYFLDGYIRMGFDYYTERQVKLSSFKEPDGTIATRYEMKDYYNGQMYVRVNNDTCYYHPIPDYDVMRPPCIPDDARYIGPATLGYGAHAINVDSWVFFMPFSANQTSEVIMTVTRDHCVPISETIIGFFQNIPNPIEETLFFTEYYPGVEDLNNLHSPDDCVPGTGPLGRVQQ